MFETKKQETLALIAGGLVLFGSGVFLGTGFGGAWVYGSIEQKFRERLAQEKDRMRVEAGLYHESFMKQLPNYMPDWVGGIGDCSRDEWMIQDIREKYKK